MIIREWHLDWPPPPPMLPCISASGNCLCLNLNSLRMLDSAFDFDSACKGNLEADVPISGANQAIKRSSKRSKLVCFRLSRQTDRQADILRIAKLTLNEQLKLLRLLVFVQSLN